MVCFYWKVLHSHCLWDHVRRSKPLQSSSLTLQWPFEKEKFNNHRTVTHSKVCPRKTVHIFNKGLRPLRNGFTSWIMPRSLEELRFEVRTAEKIERKKEKKKRETRSDKSFKDGDRFSGSHLHSYWREAPFQTELSKVVSKSKPAYIRRYRRISVLRLSADQVGWRLQESRFPVM